MKEKTINFVHYTSKIDLDNSQQSRPDNSLNVSYDFHLLSNIIELLKSFTLSQKNSFRIQEQTNDAVLV